MRNFLLSLIACFCFGFTELAAQHIIHVEPSKTDGEDMTLKLQAAINEAAAHKGRGNVIIRLGTGEYHLYRKSATARLYHVSNTTSEAENPHPVKHIGLWMKNLKNVTFDGNGARLVTHGEMTTYFIDSCENITLKNFMLTAADPTVPELTITEKGERHLTVRIHPQSRYKLENGKFSFVGEGWQFSQGIAQAYDPQSDVTWRTESPLSGLKRAIELEPGLLRFVYDRQPVGRAGLVYQMRDAIRDEVCGCTQFSRNVTLEGIHFAFLGNFGLVGQMSENLTYRRLTFEPELNSGRTCAGFADFVQMSGCKGQLLIEDCRFVGAHDDPINIHGTHLAIKKFIAPNRALIRYMHGQSYGFASFLPGNEVDFIDAHSLLPMANARVCKAEMKNEREMEVTFTRSIPESIRSMKDLVLENVTFTPEVTIRHNFFSRIPTRGILLTTRRRALIENNTFLRTQMSAILIADDARSWFESGMVRDLTIRGNRFIECNGPVVLIAPENDKSNGYVHRNITIENNLFILKQPDAVRAKSVDGLTVKNNLFMLPENCTTKEVIHTHECGKADLNNNAASRR